MTGIFINNPIRRKAETLRIKQGGHQFYNNMKAQMKNTCQVEGFVSFPEVKKAGSSEILNFTLSQKVGKDKPRYRNFPVKKWNPEYIPSKGDKVEVTGYLEWEEWDDKKLGSKKSRMVIMALEIAISANNDADNSNIADAKVLSEINNADDLPF